MVCEEYENICYISTYFSASEFLSIISNDLEVFQIYKV